MDERPPTPTDEFLERVLARGRILRLRERILPFVVTASLFAAGIPVVSVFAGARSDRLVIADSPAPPASPTASEPSTSASPSESPSGGPSIEPSPSDEPPLVCRDSVDERCGPFRWDPEPQPNRPASVSITYEPAEPVVGEEVTFSITVTDPDAPFVGLAWYDMVYIHGDAMSPCSEGYGPWTPPSPSAGEETITYKRVYRWAGEFPFEVEGGSSNPIVISRSRQISLCQDPYADRVRDAVTVTVREAPPVPAPDP